MVGRWNISVAVVIEYARAEVESGWLYFVTARQVSKRNPEMDEEQFQ